MRPDQVLLKGLPCLLFKPLRDGDCATSLGNLFLYCTSLVVLKFSLQSDLIILLSDCEGGSTQVLSQSSINTFTLNMLLLFSEKDP